MLLITFSALLLSIAIAAPLSRSAKSDCKAGNFDNPWVLNDITVWEPANSSTSQTGVITFSFSDSNKELELGTDCIGTVTNGACVGEDGGYISCENENISFKLTDGQILMERFFIDDW